MEFFKNKQREKVLSRVIILLCVSFLLGEIIGLYSISNLKNDLDTVFSTFHTEQKLIRKLRIMFWFYLPCLLLLIHCRWFAVIPAVLFCRGYLFSCSLAAFSIMNEDNMGNVFGITIPVWIQTASLIVLSSSLFYYQLVKQKYFSGNLAAERQALLKSVFLALCSITICSAYELIIHS